MPVAWTASGSSSPSRSPRRPGPHGCSDRPSTSWDDVGRLWLVGPVSGLRLVRSCRSPRAVRWAATRTGRVGGSAAAGSGRSTCGRERSVRVQLVKLGVLSALVTAVVAQTASAHELTAGAGSAENASTTSAVLPVDLSVGPAVTPPVVAVPDAWSFDDAHGAFAPAAGAAGRVVVAARRTVAPPKPPKPPTKASSGALPRAGTPQAVLAAAYVRAAAAAPASCHLRPAH